MQTLAGTRLYAQRMEGFFGGEIDLGLVDIIQHALLIYVAFQTDDGHTWVSAISAQEGTKRSLLVQVLGAHRVRVHGVIVSGDPILGGLAKPNYPLGITIMQEYTRDRVRINGLLCGPASMSRLDDASTNDPAAGVLAMFEVETSLVLGLCPKYIVDRRIVQRRPNRPTSSMESSQQCLPVEAVELLRTADTFWLGTTEPSWGSQSSHRGGHPGFIRVLSRPQHELPLLEWGDYNGNKFYHSLGSALSNPRCGVSVLDYQHGHLLQLVGELKVVFADRQGSDLDGTDKHVHFAVQRWRWTREAVPFAFRTVSTSVHNPRLKEAARHNDSKDDKDTAGDSTLVAMSLVAVYTVAVGVKTFRFEPLDSSVRLRWVPAQYATMRLSVDGQTYERSWTITSLSLDGPSRLEVTIKRAEQGVVSRFLHERARKGLVVQLVGIEGSFTVPSMFWQIDMQDMTDVAGKPIYKLWLSAGIGITPFIAHMRAMDRFYRVYDQAGVSTPRGDWVWLHIDQSLDHVPALDTIASAVALSQRLAQVNVRVVLALTQCTSDQLLAPGGSVYLRACDIFGEREVGEGGRIQLVPGRPQADTLMTLPQACEVKDRAVDACASPAVMEQFRLWLSVWHDAGQPVKNFRTDSFSY